MLADVLNDQRGGYLDLTTGTVWPAELVDDGQVEGLEPFEEADPELWLECPGRVAATLTATWRTHRRADRRAGPWRPGRGPGGQERLPPLPGRPEAARDPKINVG
jgi:hypothetical protein